mmetsp:Transcript_19016/g.48551  ORF Transcript_19016/g.48551 Transcript_19016/m.48551 type:complete len:383 (+) Transcript_19016:232-1380(+)
MTVSSERGTWKVEKSQQSLDMMYVRMQEKSAPVPKPPTIQSDSSDCAQSICDWLKICAERGSQLASTPVAPFLVLRLDQEVAKLRESEDWMETGVIKLSHSSLSNSPASLPSCMYRSLSDEPAWASLLLIHGYSDSGRRTRFQELAYFFCKRGIHVFTLDLPGHGESSGVRGYVKSKDALIAAGEAGVDELKRKLPHLPLFVYGISMGGAIAVNVGMSKKDIIAGVLLSSPMLAVSEKQVPILRKLAFIGAYLVPRLRLIALPRGAGCTDDYYNDLYLFDSLCYVGKVYNRTGYEMLRLAESTSSLLSSVSFPFFVSHGGADELTSPTKSEELYSVAVTPENKKRIVIHPGLLHNPFDEPGCFDRVMNPFVTYMKDMVDGPE